MNRRFAQGSQGAHWHTGQLIDTLNRLTINMFQESDSDWNCHHVIAAEDRIVVETRACLRDKTTSVVANAIANLILDKGKPPQLWWIFPLSCKAQWLAVVDLQRDLAWLLTMTMPCARPVVRIQRATRT